MDQIPVQTYDGWGVQPSSLAPTYMNAFKPMYLVEKARRIKQKHELTKFVRQQLKE